MLSKRDFLSSALAGAALIPLAADAVGHGAAPVRTPVFWIPKQSRTTGSIAAGSNQLTVASTAGFVVGDPIIVELGGEASLGKVGSPGVGGVWPALSYPNEAAMNADTSQAPNIRAYCQDTGTVFQWKGYMGAGWRNDPTEPYWSSAVPLALLATITAINGKVLTLSATASAAAANANVYFDCAPGFNAIVQNPAPNSSFTWPAGNFAVGSILSINRHGSGTVNGLLIAGKGQAQTNLFSPKGVISAGIETGIQSHGCPGIEISNLTITGNATLNGPGWGLDLRVKNSGITVPNWNYAIILQASDYANVHDVTLAYPWLGCGSRYSSNCIMSRVRVTTDGLLRYISWMINWVNCTACFSYDCEVDSTHITKAFEIFASNHCGHIRPTTKNGMFALNSTGDCVIDTPKVTLTPMSVYSQLSIPFPGTSIIDINQNINQNRGRPGNNVLNMNITVQGVVNGANDCPQGINVSNSINTLIRGGTYTGVAYQSPSSQYGAQAVNSDASSVNTQVSGLTVVGMAKDGGTWNGQGNQTNIYVEHGTLNGQTCDTWYCAGAHS